MTITKLTTEEREKLVDKLQKIVSDLESGYVGFEFLYNYICNNTWMANCGHTVAYLCDGYGCKRNCAEKNIDKGGPEDCCWHTCDVKHAKNFTDAFELEEPSGLYMEIPEYNRDNEK